MISHSLIREALYCCRLPNNRRRRRSRPYGKKSEVEQNSGGGGGNSQEDSSDYSTDVPSSSEHPPTQLTKKYIQVIFVKSRYFLSTGHRQVCFV
jgi:hypothetical protein